MVPASEVYCLGKLCSLSEVMFHTPKSVLQCKLPMVRGWLGLLSGEGRAEGVLWSMVTCLTCAVRGVWQAEVVQVCFENWQCPVCSLKMMVCSWYESRGMWLLDGKLFWSVRNFLVLVLGYSFGIAVWDRALMLWLSAIRFGKSGKILCFSTDHHMTGSTTTFSCKSLHRICTASLSRCSFSDNTLCLTDLLWWGQRNL